MLTNETISSINAQIQDELRTVDRTFAPHQEKMEAIERAAALKALMDPVKEEVPEPTRRPSAEDWLEMLRRRA